MSLAFHGSTATAYSGIWRGIRQRRVYWTSELDGMKRNELIQYLVEQGCRQRYRRGRSPWWTDAARSRRTSLPRRPVFTPEDVERICKKLGVPLPPAEDEA